MLNREDKFRIEEYNYTLPEDRIAKFPLEKRDESKLLVYRDEMISIQQFRNIVDYLPENSLLLFNDTKVIAARLHFFKETGAKIEIFLLEPIQPYHDYAGILQSTGKCSWKCTIGNKKKWKEGTALAQQILVENQEFTLKVSYKDFKKDIVTFEWEGSVSFADIVHVAGKVPIPPYLQRDEEEIDKTRYQTVFSKYEGAVAAPTAGLHFTEATIASLNQKNITHDFMTLHVSAGTFRPVQSENYLDHDMHREQILVKKETIEKIIRAERVICVGTTALRTLESLYWLGVKSLNGLPIDTVEKLYPYESHKSLPHKWEALKSLGEQIGENLVAETEIFIFPGYRFRLCDGLITNFHLPKSTLLLLIAAFVGTDWKKIYKTALNTGFRFLSYGDSSLLFKNTQASI